jgi:mercuric ion transport protein
MKKPFIIRFGIAFQSLLLTLILAISLPAMAASGNTPLFEQLISFWPFIIALVLLLLAVLWYQNIQSMRRSRARGRKATGLNSMVLLGLVTVFVVVLLAAPWYLNRLEQQAEQEETPMAILPENQIELVLTVESMTCTGCENLIERRVGALEGVASVDADHQAMKVKAVYDKSRMEETTIAQTIEMAGYKVVETKKEQN